MAGSVKDYNYDDVMEFTGAGGKLDECLSAIQESVKTLRIKVEELEEMLHGESSTTGLAEAYNKFYGMIGKPGQPICYWDAIDKARTLIDFCYENAYNQSVTDQEL